MFGSIISLMALTSCGGANETSESSNFTSDISVSTDTGDSSSTFVAPVLDRIAVTGEVKTIYNFGEELVKPEITAYYVGDAGFSEVVTDQCLFTGYNAELEGNQTVTVSFTDEDITKQTTFDVTVNGVENLLKFAVFADVQLCYYEQNATKQTISNVGSVANAALALKNHFAYCKDQDVDVIFMVGDIVNNANQYYYDYYQSIFESVYGTDESKYPEVIWSIGNHEWWGTSYDEGYNEKDIGRAMSLFNANTNLDSPYLVRRSAVKYYKNNADTVPTFYKVVKGVPFLCVSGENSAGDIGSQLRGELESWLQEISQLPSVQAGGPIYVAYHWPLSNTQTFGHGKGRNSYILEEILKDYPTAVVYTGDTHYPGVNERSINQGDFTTINIGSSSYSRMDTMAATMQDGEHFYNLEGGSDAKDVVNGNAAYLFEYTPTIHMVDVTTDYTSHMNRYFSNENLADVQHINKEWVIPHGANKSTFKYTNARFENKTWANDLYDADGVSWAQNATLKFGVKDNQMTVKFPDTIEYHYTEHFKIKVTSNTNNSKIYDVVSNYFKYARNPEELYFVLEDLPSGSSYNVEVTAYDYFDNPSLNKLTSSVNDPTCCADKVDTVVSEQYSDISTRINLDDVAPGGSQSSLEYYYKGANVYNYGATLNRFYDIDLAKSAADFVSITSESNLSIIVKAKFKNLCDGNVTIGLVIINSGGSWLSDFGGSTRQTIEPNTGWVELEWNVSELAGLTGRDSIGRIGFKANSSNMSTNGYSFHLLMDDADIYGEKPLIIETPTKTNNLEMMKMDEGWCYGTTNVVSNDTYGPTSTSSRRFNFKDSLNNGKNPLSSDLDSTDRCYIAFSPENQWGSETGITLKNTVLSFDFKPSSEILDSPLTYKYMFTMQIVDGDWTSAHCPEYWFDWVVSGKSGFIIENSDNGWFHFEYDFSQKTELADFPGNLLRIRIGVFGLTESTKTNAYMIIDNMTLTPAA